MPIPSYDDLTPGIPDVAETIAATVARLTRCLEDGRRPQAGGYDGQLLPGFAAGFADGLYACLRSAAPARAALVAVARDFSPRLMTLGNGEVLLDVSGLGRLIGEPPAIVEQLTRALAAAGLPAPAACAAIAPTVTAARLLATQPAGAAPAGFAALPVALLQPLEPLPPALPPRERAQPYETLQRWGIATLGELAALPAAALSSRLGRRGAVLQRLARGLDLQPFVPDTGTPRYIGRLELEWPIETLEPLSFVLARLLDPLASKLERADAAAAAIRLELRLTDRLVHTRVLQLPAAIRDPRVLRTLLLLDLESHPPAAAVDVVTIELDPAPARITQFSLLTRALPSPETLSTLTARLTALAGASRVGLATLPDSHRSGAFEMVRFNPGADGRIAVAAASVAPAPVLRRQRLPLAIRVRADDGRPVHVAAARRGLPSGAVIEAAGPWRSSGEWWRPGDGLATGWNRDEWDVALADGTICRIYQDRAHQRWFLEGIYD